MGMHKSRNERFRWVVFLVVAAVLSALVWVGWSVITRSHSIPGLLDSGPDTKVSVGITDMPQSLDIRATASASAERLLLDNVYETLLTVDQNNQLKPGVATDWKTSDDGLTYTMTIASGLTFSNGHTLDAGDVVWSLQQAITQKYAGVDDLGDLKSATNPNDSTVVITLAQTNPTLLRALSGRLGIVYDSEAGDADYAKQAVGSGPFTVGKFTPGQSLTLDYNGGYHGTKAHVGTVTFTQYSDETSLADAVSKGTIDMAAPATATVASQMNGKDGLTVTEGATTDKVLLAFNNNSDSIMSDQNVRTTFRYLIDSAGIAASQSDSSGALGGPISPLEPGYEDLTGLFPHDMSKTQTMTSYFGPYLTTVDLVVTAQWQPMAETIKQQIEQLPRPSVNLEVVSDEEYAKRIQDGTWELTLMSMNGTDDAGTFADPNSIFHYNHAEAQQAYADARAATNDADYAEKMKVYARKLSEDAASNWLYTRKCFTVASTKLSGYPTALIDQRMPLADLTVK